MADEPRQPDEPVDETGAADSSADAPGKSDASELVARLGQRSGLSSRYELRAKLARGGMGSILQVWDQDLRRPLAMKVMHQREPERTPHALARFLEEAQVTGQLDHPGVVPVHDLGLDSFGRVFFTMRLVRGRTFAEVGELARQGADGWSLARAVGALLKVCETVAYAHDKGVLHRDLKPANVMIGRFGEVYVMDWGLARTIGRASSAPPSAASASALASLSEVRTDRRDSRESGSETELVTLDGDVLGTPAYMPPEQAGGALDAIGKTTDVYALGAMLYQLLAGLAPYERRGPRRAPREILLAVLNGPPERLERVAPSAPSELVAICERAMARAAAERYASALDLADDLRAWLEGRVVRAYERGAVAELRKWVGRNRALAATLAASVAIVVAGATLSALILAGKNRALAGATRDARASETAARASEAIAVREVATTARTLEFLEQMFTLQTPERALGQTITVKQVLDRESARIAGELADEPVIRARLMRTMGDVYRSLGLLSEAEPLLEEARRVALECVASDDLLARDAGRALAALRIEQGRGAQAEQLVRDLEAAAPSAFAPADLSLLASALLAQGRVSEARAACERALAGLRAERGLDHRATLAALSQLGEVERQGGELAAAAERFAAALARARAALGASHPDTLALQTTLAGVYVEQARHAEAEELLVATLTERRRILGGEHPDTLRTQSQLAALYHSLGRFAEAEPLLRASLASLRRAIGDDHPQTVGALGSLAVVLRYLGRADEAEPLAREACARSAAQLGDEHPDTLSARSNLGALLVGQGRYAEAEGLLASTLDARRRTLGDEHLATLDSLNNLAVLYASQGRFAEAEPLQREVLDARRRTLGPDHPRTLASLGNLAGFLRALGRGDEAEPLLVEMLARARATLGNEHQDTLAALDRLGTLRQAQGRLAEAEELVREALTARRAQLGPEHPSTLASLNNLGNLYRALGRREEAEALLREAADGARKTLGLEHPDAHSLIALHGVVLFELGRLDEAEPALVESYEGRLRLLGEAHPDTLLSIQSLAALCFRTGRLDEAESLARALVERTPSGHPLLVPRQRQLEAIRAAIVDE